MKRALSLLMALVLCLSLCACGDDSSNELAYEVNEDGKTCTITGIGSCKDTVVNIPETINDYKVTAIGINAFWCCSNLTSINIPDSVTDIGDSAFVDCTGLTSIIIPDSVTSIGLQAFWGCTSLTEIFAGSNNPSFFSLDGVLYTKDRATLLLYPVAKADDSFSIPDSVTSIGSSAFQDCMNLTSITIPNGVASIGSSAFQNCNGLTSITIPDSVTSIGSSAFQECRRLASITIPNGVASIGDNAFFLCTSLASITIPDSVTSIGLQAFWGCTSLTEIFAGSNNPSFFSLDGVLYTKDRATLLLYPAAKADVSFSIPDGVTSISAYAFAGCSSLTEITIPDSLIDIGLFAFADCSSLTEITIPDSLTDIGRFTFAGCTGLTSITIPDSVTSIGNWMFSDCNSLTSIIFNGTKQQWNAIDKGDTWDEGTPAYTIHCTDGDIAK
ncbi:MAG: leucine-rich repeat domain-containing protein [Faecousia sp.]